MRILVCVKRVPAPGSRINVTADGLAVDTAFLGFTTSPHEECAVEAAVQLAEAHGGSTTVLSVGPPEAEEQLRYAVSVGVGAAILVSIADPDGDGGGDWDPQRTAAAIVDAVRDTETADGPFDVILFGNESADSGGFQVGIRVATALGRPVVNGAKALSITSSTEGQVVRIERESDSGRIAFELPLPAVVGVKEGINLPRYPTMKGRLASKKVPVTTLAAPAAPGGLRLVSLETPAEQVVATEILGNGPDAAGAVVDLLEEIGVLR